MLLSRRTLISTVPAALALSAGFSHSQTFPSKPIRIISPFAPGGFTDIYGRVIGERMSKTFNHPVIVENKPGAGGNLASEYVASSEPDGHTLLMGTIGTHAVNVSLFKSLKFDPVTDFVAVAMVVESEGVLVVHPSVQAKSVKELMAMVKSSSNKLTIATGGIGTASHLAAEAFKTAVGGADIPLAHYRSQALGVSDTLAGHTAIMFANLPTVIQYVKDGKVKPLGVIGAKRSAALPDVPTVAEAGIPGFNIGNWAGLFAPAKTPTPVVAKIHSEVERIMRLPEVQARMVGEGSRHDQMSSAQFEVFVKSEIARWAPVIRASGATAE